ncbi:hypothetical protein J2X55_002415 [Microbacterium sp. 1154]|uniref:hypothetical protein n=1 Tax=Microbacterium sp. 1154 TaxID=2817733 RepID=UPI0028619345|nr:hypothetical protein [Microbacterium sp. 1154]MDR6691492.1 hypothetical protein [Microbacterium sp. 1154]
MVYDGREYAFPCDGCAAEPTVGGTLVCSKCRGRFRFALREVPDLVGRMRSLIDPTSAIVYEDRARRTGSPSPEAPAPVAADLIDASEAVQKGLWRWSPGGGWPRSDAAEAFDDAEAAAAGILAHLDTWLSDEDDVFSLYRLLLERHPANEDGVREAWSVQDALDKWGAERREQPAEEAVTASRALRPERVFDEESARPIAEHGDRLLGGAQAAAIAGSLRTLQRWAKAGEIVPEASPYVAGRKTPLYRESALLAVKERMAESKTMRGHSGRFTQGAVHNGAARIYAAGHAAGGEAV